MALLSISLDRSSPTTRFGDRMASCLVYLPSPHATSSTDRPAMGGHWRKKLKYL
jgi:hypothetical protein